MTVEEVHAKMALGEFYRWADYMAEEPLLPDRVDIIGGVIASTIANVNRAKGATAFTHLDFMPIAKAIQQRHLDALDEEQFALMQMERFRVIVGGKGRLR
jgi:hypothetical protein